MDVQELLRGARGDAARPVVQLAIDVTDVDQAVAIGEMGLRAGADWLELGTPLVAFAGINNVEAFARAFSDSVTFLDAKIMDAPGRYVAEAARLGIDIVCVCAAATDASFRAAFEAAAGTSVKIVGDLYGYADPIPRAIELDEMGVDLIYLHYGFDQHREEPNNVTLSQIAELKTRVSRPIGVVTFDEHSGVAAAEAGADIVLVTHPFLVGPDAESKLTAYVRAVKAAAARVDAAAP